MAVELIWDAKRKSAKAVQPESVSSLTAGFYGVMNKGVITLFPEETMYLMDIRNAKCTDAANNTYTFNDVAGAFDGKKLIARYITYKDWRDRGLIVRPSEEVCQRYGRNPIKAYPQGKFEKPGFAMQARFYEDDLVAIIDDDAPAKELYERWWFGQFASYKAEQRGKLGKLDVFETLFLMKHCGLKVVNADGKKVMHAASERHPDFKALYEVYEDWRMQGFVLKTGFKFGTHFRLYFPGAVPGRGQGEWMHSKHVIHVFPRESRLLISEWARAIRVAHSVRKTFLLAIPGQTKKIKEKGAGKGLNTTLDFLLYHRKGTDIEKPKGGLPRFLMLSLSEEEYLSGAEMADAIEECKRIGLELIIAIADRETSVTYYAIKRVELPGSDYEYYEIEWMQP